MQPDVQEIKKELEEIQGLLRRGMTKHEVVLEMVKLINCGRNYPTFEERRTMLLELYRDVFMMISEVERI
ncbi:MAG: hypothetical protein HQM09_23710 [Candidatus Riflebacteria bacterium]|nr:hypothetical protein [Candidatus Riflebacteria bacterium]